MKELLDRAKHEDWQIEYIQRNPYAASSHDKTRYEKYKIALRSAKNMVWIHGHSLPREAIFSILRRYGLPDHFVNVVIRLHYDAKLKIKIGGEDSEIPSKIGVRQGSCEGPVLFIFMMQAVMETIEWPEAIKKPVFRTRVDGELYGTKPNQAEGVTFEFWVSLFADDCVLLFDSREQLQLGVAHINEHFKKLGMKMHVGVVGGANKSKTEAMYIPGRSRSYQNGDTAELFFMGPSALTVYFVEFVESFKYLGSIIHHSLTSSYDVKNRINAATAAMSRLKGTLQRLDIDVDIRGKIYATLVMNILLYGSECWTMTAELLRTLRVFHARNLRIICRTSILMTRHKHISTDDLQEKLSVKSLNYYYYTRLLRWLGHIARMPFSRIPRKFLTGFVEHKRPQGGGRAGCWGRSACAALEAAGLPKEYSAWSLLAQDKVKWRQACKSAASELDTLGCCTPTPP
mmetsp:Transcript_34064/g.40061  ORF Transcript_34064/g.40061 Transcript_34064/m.40061 type:complete len:458 (-) Transcript_34064:220-1593(-)